ncbi:hypothetical protein GY45DRAFT_391180 [Cubamyces sp. BRFM 1775]|nr:hypothetical protein GY45DRAFT_391180 [Cubamyces sp. BRFM 1775]
MQCCPIDIQIPIQEVTQQFFDECFAPLHATMHASWRRTSGALQSKSANFEQCINCFLHDATQNGSVALGWTAGELSTEDGRRIAVRGLVDQGNTPVKAKNQNRVGTMRRSCLIKSSRVSKSSARTRTMEHKTLVYSPPSASNQDAFAPMDIIYARHCHADVVHSTTPSSLPHPYLPEGQVAGLTESTITSPPSLASRPRHNSFMNLKRVGLFRPNGVGLHNKVLPNHTVSLPRVKGFSLRWNPGIPRTTHRPNLPGPINTLALHFWLLAFCVLWARGNIRRNRRRSETQKSGGTSRDASLPRATHQPDWMWVVALMSAAYLYGRSRS